jgi:hypothetical protein
MTEICKVKNGKYTLSVKLPRLTNKQLKEIPQSVKDNWERIATEFLNKQKVK